MSTEVIDSRTTASIFRPPSRAIGSRGRVEKLEMLRGFAALYVFLYHLTAQYSYSWGPPGALVRFGQEAVMLFFLLSGFVICLTAERRQCSFKEYIIRRAVRIYPTYLLAIGLGAVDIVFLKQQQIQVGALLGNLCMLQDLAFVKPGTWIEPFANIDPFWSLAYEWWFYLLFFPIWSFVPRNRWIWTSAGISCVGLVSFVVFPNQISLYLLYFYLWWVGVEFGYEFFHTGRVTVAGQKTTLLLLLGIVIGSTITFLSCALPHYLGVGGFPVLFVRHFVCVLIVCAGAFLWQKASWLGFDWVFKRFLWAAPISYGVYLLHFPLCITGSFLKWTESPVLRAAYGVPIVLLAAWFAERRLQPAVNRWVSKWCA